uniref:DUF1279 domain-containing protein n=1 Tax=Syphacia muris TaxID=451379 RepID=A0A0N5AAG6_9BILA
MELANFRIRMDDEERRRKLEEIKKMQMEKKPESKIALLKYYVKRYWYIAIPVHLVSSLIWFLIAFVAVKSGVDVVGLLQHIHAPEYILEKIKSARPHASVVVIALILYKIATPLRYATTLAGIKLTFTALKKIGKLRTAKEVTFKMRVEYTKRSDKLRRRYKRFTKHAFRIIRKKKFSSGNGKNGHDITK